MSKKFPNFADHASAHCFCCGERLSGEVQDSGNAHGRGQFVQVCGKTGMRTWYDLLNPQAELFIAEMHRFAGTSAEIDHQLWRKGSDDDAEQCSDYVTSLLIADIFDVPPVRVGRDLFRYRARNTE
jgi:hypothetical protein